MPGVAAVAAVLMPSLGDGDVVVVPGDSYPGVCTIAVEQLRPRGVAVRIVASDEDAVRGALDGATLVWIETPSNPGLAVLDVQALAAAAHDAGALLAVDNTLATPLTQRPLALGADLSVSSASKLLTGHSDLVLGYVAVADPERAQALRARRRGDELRRRAQLCRAAAALGHRRRLAGLYPPQHRLGGRSRSHRRRVRRAGRVRPAGR